MRILILLIALSSFFLFSFFDKCFATDDFYKKESFEIRPGITRHKINLQNDKGPVEINILEIDLSNEKISFKVGLPDKNKIKSLSKLTDIVRGYMAYIGVNANYFDRIVGNPLGTLIVDGNWITGPVYNRVALGFSEDNNVFVDQVMLSGLVTVSRGLFNKKPFAMFEINSLNTPVDMYENIGIFMPEWGDEIALFDNKLIYVIRNGCVRKIAQSSANIPKDGYVIVSNESKLVNFLKKNDCLDIEWKSVPDWGKVKEAVSGGPYLIMNGEIYIDEKEQNIRFAEKDKYAPRSAIGVGKDNKFYIVTVDGRKPEHSVGITLSQLAKVLKNFNLLDAINLDGGGSAALVIDGKVVNKISDEGEREISNALLLFYSD